MKVQKQTGQHYLPMTIQHYLVGLQCYIRNLKGNALNFMVDIDFLRKLLDVLYRRLHEQRIGCFMKKSVACFSLISLAVIDKEGVCVFS